MSSVQTQTQSKKGELIGQFHGKMVTTTIRDISPFGVNLSMNGTSEFTGRYSASQMDTVNVTINQDGTAQYETKVIQNTMDGDFVVVASRGTRRTAGPTTFAFEGEAIFMTQSPKLGWLNTTKAWIEGTMNNVTSEYEAQVYAQKA
jgi:hypothetical protein